MKGGILPLGYTIVEVMIVLAVSGAMFLIASSFITDKQANTAFTTGTSEFVADVQRTINEVSNGQFPDAQFNCTYVTGVGTDFNNLGSLASQGSNSDCVFLGKVMHFRQHTASADFPENYEVFTLAGGRADPNDATKPITDVLSANPKAVDKPGVINLTAQETVPQHLQVVYISATLEDGTSSTYNAVGFLQDSSRLDSGAAGLKSGIQAVKLFVVDSIQDDKTREDVRGLIDKNHLHAAKAASIYVSDGIRCAQLRLGDTTSNTSQLSVEKIMLGRRATCP